MFQLPTLGLLHSSVQKELIGPYQLLTAGKIDQNAGTITMPLYQGRVVQGNLRNVVKGVSIWYILTDTSDEGAAKGLGLNFSSKLRFANVGSGARWSAVGADNKLSFDKDSYVDFSPVRTVIPGNAPNYFPPQEGNQPRIRRKQQVLTYHVCQQPWRGVQCTSYCRSHADR